MYEFTFKIKFLLSIAWLVLLGIAQAAHADAIVVSQAMFADSIAEYMVEEDHVRVELEIGAGDVGAFRNLMPDALYEQLGHAPRPLAERIEEFFRQDLTILADWFSMATF